VLPPARQHTLPQQFVFWRSVRRFRRVEALLRAPGRWAMSGLFRSPAAVQARASLSNASRCSLAAASHAAVQLRPRRAGARMASCPCRMARSMDTSAINRTSRTHNRKPFRYGAARFWWVASRAAISRGVTLRAGSKKASRQADGNCSRPRLIAPTRAAASACASGSGRGQAASPWAASLEKTLSAGNLPRYSRFPGEPR